MQRLRGEGGPTGPDGDIVDRLQALATSAPDSVLYIELLNGTVESGRLTAAELRDRAASLATVLVDGGLERGQVALLIATPPLEFLIGLLACMWAGVIAAPIAFPRRAEHLESRLEPVRANADAVAIVAGTPQGDAERAVLEILAGGTLPVIAATAQASGPTINPVPDRDIAYLQYTSGSTSDPRGVIVTHENLTENLEVCRALLDYRTDSVNVSWCPLTHDMGLIMGALPSVGFGMTSVLMPPSAFIRRPMTWMRALNTYRGTHGYSPNFGYDLCVERSTPEERAELDLSCVRTLINGAEPVRQHTRDRFVEAFAPSGMKPSAHAPGYGLAESAVLVSVAPEGSSGMIVSVDANALEHDEVVYAADGAEGARVLVGDGMPGPGYDIRIVDPVSAEPTPDGHVGELWLRGPSVSPGYWRRDDATADVFGGRLAGDDGGPYLRTGDLAFLSSGEIVICGRIKDLIVIRGRNIHPQDVELTAELSHPAIRSGGSAAFSVQDPDGEALVVVVEVDEAPDATEVAGAVRAAILREFELRVADVMLVGPHQVPKTSSGKKQRSATRALWQRGEREPLPV